MGPQGLDELCWKKPLCGMDPISCAKALSAAIRFSVAGWVENRLSTPWPDSGLMMKSEAVAGRRSASGFGICATPPAMRARAEARLFVRLIQIYPQGPRRVPVEPPTEPPVDPHGLDELY